MLLCEDIAE
jgi:hypothetical protein